MRMLFIFHDRPNYWGGPIVNARRLLPELVRRGHEVFCVIFFTGREASSKDYLAEKGVKCNCFQFGGYTEKQIKLILKNVSTINPDIFIPNLSVAGWFAARWARQAGIPTIACHRSDDEFHWAMVKQFVTGDPVWAVSGLVCVSAGINQKIKNDSPKHTRLCVIPSGVPLSDQISRQTEPLRIVYVGRIVQEQKRIIDLIDSIANVMKSEDTRIIATLIGDGPDLQAAKDRVNYYRLNDRIIFKGTVTNDEIHTVLAQYHVLILLSDYEGTPGAVMDGMAAGLVPVCLDIPGGVRELVLHEQTGLLVQDRAQNFYDAIKRLKNDVNLRTLLAENARIHIKNHFSLHIAANRWEDFCSELLKDSESRSPLIIPSKFHLPPVRSGLKREDRRLPNFKIRVKKVLNSTIKRTLSLLWP